MIDQKIANQWAQNAHFFGGMTLVFATLVLLGNHALWITLPIFVLFTAIKEFWYDFHYETEIERGSSLEDFFVYQAGALVALIAWAFQSYLIHP